MEQNKFTDKEILTDLLCSEKQLSGSYNTARLESATPAVVSCFAEIGEEEHRIQRGIFNMMHSRGLYPTPTAEEKKISETKQCFEAATSPLAIG